MGNHSNSRSLRSLKTIKNFVHEQAPSEDVEILSNLGINAVTVDFDKKKSVDVLKWKDKKKEQYKKKNGLSLERETATTTYSFKLRSGISEPIPNTKIEYTVYRREVVRGKGRQFFSKEPTETVELGDIEPKGERTFESPEYIGQELELSYTEDKDKNFKCAVNHIGVLMKVTTNGELLHRFAFPQGFDLRINEYEDLQPVEPAEPYPTWPSTEGYRE